MSRRVYLLGVGLALVALGLAVTDRALGRPCPILNQEVFDRIQEGMTQAEVEAILGPPTRRGMWPILFMTHRSPRGPASLWEKNENVLGVWFVGGRVTSRALYFATNAVERAPPDPLARLRAWLGW